MKKSTLIIGIVVLIVVVFGVLDIFEKYSHKESRIIGGERDKYGCLISAGYSYDGDIMACTRSWELGSDDKKRAAKIAVEAATSAGVDDIAYTVVDISGKGEEGSFSVKLERSEKVVMVDIDGWEHVGVRPNSIAGVRPENLEVKDEVIHIESPLAWSFVDSPIKVKGEARGYWFFEGDFPVTLNDADGDLLATGIAKAQGEWMTEEFVPFGLELRFDVPEGALRYGVLVFHRDNPSGLKEHEEEVDVPVYFK